MPSIRRSLIGYFLLLMGVTLGGVGLLVDRFVVNAIRAREVVEADRAEKEYQSRTVDTRKQFDKELEDQAKSLARELREKYNLVAEEELQKFRLLMTNVLLVELLADGTNRWTAPLMHFTTNYPPYRGRLLWNYMSGNATLIDERVRKSFESDDHPEIFEFHYPWSNRILRSHLQSFALPINVEELNRKPQLGPEYHEAEMPNVGLVRWVVLRSQLPRFLQPGTSRGSRPPPDRGDRTGPPPGPTQRDSSLYVLYGRRLTDLEPRLQKHVDHRDDELELMANDRGQELANFRLSLLGISLLTVIAIPIGGWFIVRRGLRPLNTLSTAVSHVSERDFRLPVKAGELSYELLPIHDRLNGTLDALKRAFEREKQAVADISHELRTPLAALRTTLDVSLRKPREAAQYKATMEDCRDISKQLSRLVDRILTLAAMDADHASAVKIPVNVSELAAECVTVIRPLADGQTLTLTTELDPKATATTDPDKLREVMMNLLHNAIEYSQPHGTVRLSVKPQGQNVQIAVTDTGIGMTPEVRSKIFERFYRADSSRHATGVHAGLGLSIVKEYLERLHATIHVSSEPNHGSRFEVTLPVVTA